MKKNRIKSKNVLLMLSLLLFVSILFSIFNNTNLNNIITKVSSVNKIEQKAGNSALYKINIVDAGDATLPETIRVDIYGTLKTGSLRYEKLHTEQIMGTLSPDKTHYILPDVVDTLITEKSATHHKFEITLATGISNFAQLADTTNSVNEVKIYKYQRRDRITERKVVDIPNANFKNWLLSRFKDPALRGVDIHSSSVWINPNLNQMFLTDREYLKPESEMEIYEDEMEMITALTFNGANINDFTGLEKAKRLLQFYAMNNPSFNLEPVGQLPLLEKIGLIAVWGLNDISQLQNNKNLQVVNLKYNNLEDISPLNNLEKLYEISLQYTRVADLSPLTNLPSLVHFWSNNNPYSDITPITDKKTIRQINASYTNVTTIPDLTENVNLTHLELEGNLIQDFSPLQTAPALTEWLNLKKTGLTDLTPVSKVLGLKRVNIEENNVENLSPISNMSQLLELWASKNNIVDVTPISNLTNLQKLYLNENKIYDFSSLNRVRNSGKLIDYSANKQKIVLTPTTQTFEIQLFKKSIAPTNNTAQNISFEDEKLNRDNTTYEYKVHPYTLINTLEFGKDDNTKENWDVKIDPVNMPYTPETKEFTKSFEVIGGNKETLPNTINVILSNNSNTNTTTEVATLNHDKTAYVLTKEVPAKNADKTDIIYIATAQTNITNYNLNQDRYTYVSPKTNFTIEKVWQGGDTLIPETIEVKIKRKTALQSTYTDVKTVTLRKANNWQLNITDLDQTDFNANVYEYVIEEVTRIANFTGSVNNFRITNTYTSPKQTVTKNVTVIGGGDNKPTVKVVLKKNGVIVENTEQIVDLNNGLSVNNLNQPTTDNEGRPVVYTIEVTEVVTNPNQENGTYTINNDTITFFPNKITVNGSVQIIGARVLWQDVEVALFKNNQEVPNTRKTITVNELETASNNTKQVSYDNLDKVTINNELINYEIRALTNIDKFNKSTNNNNNSFNTVYTYSNETKDIPYVINVVGGGNVPNLTVKLTDKTTGTLISQKNQTGETSGTFTNVPTRDTTTGNDISHDVEVIAPTNYVVTKEPNGTFTVKYVSPKTTFNAIVEFVNGKAPRPNVELQLLKDGQVVENSNKTVTNGQTGTSWTNIDLTNENAVNHVYSINVVGNIENYTKEYVGNNKVVLTYISPKTSKEFNIIKDGGKTVPVTIKLVKNGELLNDTTKTVNSGNKVSFENQDATDSNGNTNNYTVVVTDLPTGYTAIIGNDNNVTIKYTSPKIDIEVSKKWVNGEELIPDKIEVKLQRRVEGSNSEFTDVQTFEISKDENWEKVINSLDKTDNNANLYEYKVVEVTEIANFTGTVNNFEITNTYLSPKGNKEITVNFVGKKTEVEVKLVENNNDVNTPTIKTTGGTISFDDVDLTNTDGTEKKYTADIVTNLGDRYLKVIDNNGNITLTYVPERINVTKNVIIADSLKNKVNEVEVELYKDEKPTGITKVINISEFISNNDNTSTKQLTFENQNKEDINGNIHSYSLKLVSNIPTYISKNINDGDLKISKVIEQKEIFANINFDGGKLRPNVEVELLKDGKVIATLKANKDGKLIFGNYDTTDENGVEYNYTFNVKNEKDLNKNGYNTNVTNNSITLSYQIPKTNINFKAILQGNGDQAVPNVHIQLIRNDNPIGEVLELNGKLEHIFNNLDLTDKDGNKYKYKVVVVGNLPEFNIIPVNDTTTILRRISHTKSEVPFLPYAGAENNIILSIVIVLGIIYGINMFNKTNKVFRIKNIGKKGIR